MLLLMSLAAAEPLYTHASVVHLRARADVASASRGLVRVNTPLVVLDEDGPWVQVQLVDRPPEHPVTGWMLAAYLEPAPLPAGEAWSASVKATQAGDTDQALVWAERAVAVDPTSRSNRDLLAAAGGTGLDAPVHVAACRQGRAEVVGQVNAMGFTPVPLSPAPAPSPFSAVHWLRVRPGVVEPIQGSPFVRPFHTPQWNEEAANAYTPGTCEGICDGSRVVVLGPCDHEGEVFVSAPVEPGAARTHGPSYSPTAWLRVGRSATWEGHYARQVVSVETNGMESHVLTGFTEGTPNLDPGVWFRVDEAWFGVVPLVDETTLGWTVLRVPTEGVAIESWAVRLEGMGC